MSKLILTLGLTLLGGCVHHLRPFPDAEPMVVDPDQRLLAEPPAPYWSGIAWDGIDQTFFRPTFRALSLDVTGPAINVNAMDEVPDSSWFVNRPDVTPAQAAKGSCPDELLDPEGPWTISAAKPNGANPGFIIRDEQGRGWLIKFDGLDQPERATAADVIGSRLYYAAGFYAPCNIIVDFDPSILRIAPDAEGQDALGRERPLQQADIDTVLAAGVARPGGRLRASASLFLPGRPLGPWRYQGTRRDDPNDVVPHQDRRELRGARLLAAWTNHFDAREQNTLSVWIAEGERGFVRHYYLDFGDTLGSLWEEQGDAFSRRFGFSYYFDARDVLMDYLTLGTVRRPWEDLQKSTVAPMLGFFEPERFEPHTWKAGYPNPAFSRMQVADGAWMARIMARITDAHLDAIVDEARIADPVHEAELSRILRARRDKVLTRYLLALSPLADLHVEDGTQLCFTDLAVDSGITEGVRYQSRLYESPYRRTSWEHEGEERCVELAPDGHHPGGYVVVDIVVITGDGPLPPARAHLIDHGDEGFRLVGLERPTDDIAPGRRRR